MPTAGILLAVEGVDGSGKSVQVGLLADALRRRGRVVQVLREPGGTSLGEELRRALLDQGRGVDDALVAALLFMASRRQLVVEKIEPALARGEVVVLDRSFVSTWVYQGIVGGVDLAFLESLTERVHGPAMPDCILLLDLEASVAMARREDRGAPDAIEERGAAYLACIGDAFRQIAAQRPDRIQVVDADGTVEAVHERCMTIVEAVLAARAPEGSSS